MKVYDARSCTEPLTGASYRRAMTDSFQARAVDLHVTGTVQGVSYRAACAEGGPE